MGWQMSYNKEFDLDLDDIELIEKALGQELKRLSENRLMLTESTVKPEGEIASVKAIDEKIKQIDHLLGRLHNQKIWYRPKGMYISG